MSQAIAEAGADIKLLADSVVGQDRQDILNLMLCAELSASKKYNKNEQASQWMNHYQKRLIEYACTLEAFIAPGVTSVSDVQGFRELKFEIVGATGSQAFIAHAKASFAALQINKRVMDFFGGYSGRERTVTVNISSCELTESGGVLILFCGIQLSSSIEIEKFFLDSEAYYDVIIRSNGGAFLFDRAKYATHRDEVLRKLKEATSGIFKP